MDDTVESIDECVSCLNQQVIDLLSLRGVITRLSTNWEQLKLSLREKGLLRENESNDNEPPGGTMEEEGDKESTSDTPHSAREGTGEEAVVDNPGSGGGGVAGESDGLLEDDETEPVPVESAVGFIGPVLPTSDALPAASGGDDSSGGGEDGGQRSDDGAQAEIPQLRQNGNGDMGTQEPAVATIKSSDVVSTDTSSASLGDDYQKIECAVLYWHKTSGYIYDPVNQQFYAPASYYNQQSTTSQTSQPTYPHSSTHIDSSTSQAGQTSQTSISDVLAAASERVLERCGLEYDETAGMYYDANSALYYDQESKLYYDPDLGSYYHYDKDAKTYTLHSRVQLPEHLMRKRKREKEVEIILISDDEFNDSPEEGEIRGPKKPKIPRGSPPPEEEWAPCIRMLVSESDSLTKGELYVVTQDGTSVGREPKGTNGIKVPELQVSKSHATISYDKSDGCFTITDHGSVNGTFINSQRLSEPKQASKPHPLSHGQTLTLGSTTFILHIHTGWETCAWCDPAQWGAWQQGAQPDDVIEEEGGSLDMQRRKELNRLKKRYGLRLKDTYGEKEVQEVEGYSDRAQTRRKTVGSEPPAFHRPDDAPASVHRAIPSENVGHKMLKKLGWKEGEGLGKQGTGRSEPVQADIRGSKAGLGTNLPSRSMDSAGGTNSGIERAAKMQQRYNEVVSKELERKKRELLSSLGKY